MSGRSRRRGFGYVRKLPSGRWQASYLGPDLVRRTAPRTFDAKVDAEGWPGRRREEVVSGEWQGGHTPRAREIRPATIEELVEAMHGGPRHLKVTCAGRSFAAQPW